MPSEMKRLKQLEKRTPIKRDLLVTVLGQGNVARGGQKKAVKPDRRREIVDFLCGAYQVSIRRACGVLPRSTRKLSLQIQEKDDQAILVQRIKEISDVRVRYGYRRIHTLLRRKDGLVN